MKISDKFVVAADREKVYKFVTEPDNFIKLIPDVQKYEKVDERNFKTVFKIGLGMIKGNISMSFRYEELNPPSSVKVVGHGSGMQSTADLTISLNLNPVQDGTEVAWDADILVGGACCKRWKQVDGVNDKVKGKGDSGKHQNSSRGQEKEIKSPFCSSPQPDYLKEKIV
jgi:carbon monoxide dehydrogenase subunit G